MENVVKELIFFCHITEISRKTITSTVLFTRQSSDSDFPAVYCEIIFNIPASDEEH